MKITNPIKALIVFGTAFIIFMLIKPKLKGEGGGTEIRRPIADPTYSDIEPGSMAENGITALKAYINAHNAGENDDKLTELNNTMLAEMKVRVVHAGDCLIVVDQSGEEILRNKL